MEKTCFSEKDGGVVEVHEFYNDSEEARWVADKIHSLSRMHIPYEKMAVLYRTKFCSLPFEQAFRRDQIPYHMMGGKGFFERVEILDLNCYITAAVFDRDDTAFERVLNTPKRGIRPWNREENRSASQRRHEPEGGRSTGRCRSGADA
jgi:DNA helicase-2/ATP-dependent DNA helicase PcrA